MFLVESSFYTFAFHRRHDKEYKWPRSFLNDLVVPKFPELKQSNKLSTLSRNSAVCTVSDGMPPSATWVYMYIPAATEWLSTGAARRTRCAAIHVSPQCTWSPYWTEREWVEFNAPPILNRVEMSRPIVQMYNNNKSQQYLFEKIAGDQKGQTALYIGWQGESSFLAAARPFILFSETSINAKQLALANYSM